MQKAIQSNTPLHDAARLDDRAVAEKLIKEGADINAKDEQGNTPLAVAVGLDRGEKKLDLDRTLYWVGQGANPSSTNGEGASVWWKSSPAAQNLMVAEMQRMDRELALKEAARTASSTDSNEQEYNDAPMKVPSPDTKTLARAPSLVAEAVQNNDRYASTARHL